MSCEQCSLKFNLLRWRKTCTDCHFDFCSACILRFKGNEKLQRCRRCRVFYSIPLDRQAVMNLRVRDLLWYLNIQGVASSACREKSELVDLVMQGPRPPTLPSPPHYIPGYWSVQNSPLPARTRPPDSSPHPGTSKDDINVCQSAPERDQSWQRCSSSLSVNSQESSGGGGLTAVTVEDLRSADQIPQLSVRQLKLILTRSYVDYRGCCEKSELQDRVLRLWQQHLQTQDVEKIQDENLCKICMEAAIDSVLLECGHMVTCTKCGKHLSECPVCRQYVVRVVHTFQA